MRARIYYSLSMKTTNIRIYEETHKRLQKLAKERRQQLIVVLDELVK